MARRPKLEIDGVVYKNVYMVEYDIFTSKDETGRPTNRPRSGVIKITRESDKDTNIALWAASSGSTGWKDGEIEFASSEKGKLKTLKWKGGFISKYVETLPHTKETPDMQMFEYFEISCKALSIGDAEVDNRWDSDITLLD